MLCNRCKRNNAKYHITQNLNGVLSEVYLCESCARPNSNTSGIVTFYVVFNNTMRPLLKRMNRERVYSKKNYEGFENNGLDIEDSNSIDKSLEDNETNLLENLKSHLRVSILKEEYEKAAEYRDEIKKIEEKNNIV